MYIKIYALVFQKTKQHFTSALVRRHEQIYVDAKVCHTVKHFAIISLNTVCQSQITADKVLTRLSIGEVIGKVLVQPPTMTSDVSTNISIDIC